MEGLFNPCHSFNAAKSALCDFMSVMVACRKLFACFWTVPQRVSRLRCSRWIASILSEETM